MGKPVAFYNRDMDLITVLTKQNCGVKEILEGEVLIILEDDERENECIGFAVDFARSWCGQCGIITDGKVKLAELLASILQRWPDLAPGIAKARETLTNFPDATVNIA